MSGHSKWNTIKRKKSAQDSKRGKVFTKLIKEITVAARVNGGDMEANPRLRTAIEAAKVQNMPKENIERAIKRGTEELEGVFYEEVAYEGYGPGGVAVMVECLTDNKNRTVADVRKVFSKHGGKLGESGSVSWMFDKRGLIVLPDNQIDEDSFMEIALNLDAIDTVHNQKEGTFELHLDPYKLGDAKDRLLKEGLTTESAEVIGMPKSTVKLEGKEAVQTIKLIDALEDLDDVQNTYSNFDVDFIVLQQYVA